MSYPRGEGPRSRLPAGVSSTGLQVALSGTYQREQVSLSGLDLTAGTEYELPLAANIMANTDSKDEVFAWVNYHIVCGDTAQATVFEWMLVRCLITDATQDMDDEAVMEALQKDHRILKRGFVTAGQAAYGMFGHLKFTVHQVKLRYGEELRLVINPIYVGAAQFFYGVYEWRKVGQ